MCLERLGDYSPKRERCLGGCGKMLSPTHPTGYCSDCEPEIDETEYDLKGVVVESKS